MAGAQEVPVHKRTRSGKQASITDGAENPAETRNGRSARASRKRGAEKTTVQASGQESDPAGLKQSNNVELTLESAVRSELSADDEESEWQQNTQEIPKTSTSNSNETE